MSDDKPNVTVIFQEGKSGGITCGETALNVVLLILIGVWWWSQS